MSLGELFIQGDMWPVLLLVPAVYLVMSALDRGRARRLGNAVGDRSALLAEDLGEGERRIRRRLAAMALLLALIALLQPVWGEGLRKVEQRGVDLVVCLDVSRSMLARDLKPSRIEHARREIRALAEQARGNRLGLVAFAGDARLTVPLTRDVDSFADLVGLTDTLSIGQGGTDLGAALECALEALKGQTGDHEAVLLITDGEDLEGRGLEMARLCKARNIRVHCVGFGTSRGSKIAVEEDGNETFLRDRAGREVVTAMDKASLLPIAETTGGEFLEAAAHPLPLIELYEKRILPMAQKFTEAEERREQKNRFQWPLLAALLLWIVELCLTDRKV